MALPRNGSVVMFMLVRTTAGRPTGYPMTGLFRDGVLQITTYRKAAKARYLLADGRVCCVVPDPDRPGAGAGVHWLRSWPATQRVTPWATQAPRPHATARGT